MGPQEIGNDKGMCFAVYVATLSFYRKGSEKYLLVIIVLKTFLLNPGFVLEMAHLDYHTHGYYQDPGTKMVISEILGVAVSKDLKLVTKNKADKGPFCKWKEVLCRTF
ncbi:hypothetical protein UY3_01388 [Chelonia mydas]|uniref:Uncharacterized protein n=1 Tax=Chelonia mydas TaxID=8469 RepID=M7CK09_CHEMY|nr:hypothetical protein UY3_01388 [Chelonia mydas]